MGLFDKLTGTRHPAAGVEPATAEAIRTRLLGLNASDVPYVIREGAADQVDLVAELRTTEPAWLDFFVASQLTHTVRIRMRLVRDTHEVRALEEQWGVERVGDPPRLTTTKTYSRGPSRTVSSVWKIQRGPDGRLETTEVFRYSSAALRDLLRETVLEAGWVWRGGCFREGVRRRQFMSATPPAPNEVVEAFAVGDERTATRTEQCRQDFPERFRGDNVGVIVKSCGLGR